MTYVLKTSPPPRECCLAGMQSGLECAFPELFLIAILVVASSGASHLFNYESPSSYLRKIRTTGLSTKRWLHAANKHTRTHHAHQPPPSTLFTLIFFGTCNPGWLLTSVRAWDSPSRVNDLWVDRDVVDPGIQVHGAIERVPPNVSHCCSSLCTSLCLLSPWPLLDVM